MSASGRAAGAEVRSAQLAVKSLQAFAAENHLMARSRAA